MAILADDLNGRVIQCIGIGASQVVSYDGSVQSTAVSTNTRVVRLVATSACHVAFGANPTATTSSTYLPAGSVEYFKITAGQKIAAIKNTAAGSLYITEGA